MNKGQEYREDRMEDNKVRKGLSIAAIVLIALAALLLCITSAYGNVYGPEVIIYGVPFIAAVAIPLLAVLIILSRYCYKTDTLSDLIATIGVRYAIFGWFYVFVMKLVVVLMYLFFYDFFMTYYSTVYLLLNSANVCIGGTVVLSIVLRSVPRYKIQKRPMKIRYLLLLILIMYGLTHIGSLMGMPIHLILSSVSLSRESALGSSDIMMGTGSIVLNLTVGILPPIFEELLFRKYLIDRTIRHGEFISCVMSGIMFGLWHGNFQQFFFAFFVGVLFAFVYIRTGNIFYTMIMHASMNLVTTAVTLQLLNTTMEKMGYDMNTGAYTEVPESELVANVLPLLMLIILWLGIYVSFQIVGFIVFIVKRKKFRLAMLIGEPGRKVILHTLTHSVEMWIFFSFALLLFVYYYVPDILSVFIVG